MPKFDRPQVAEPDEPTPAEIATELGEVYFIEKEAKAEKEKYRAEFFKAATATFSPEGLAQKTVVPPADIQTEEESRAYALLYNAGYLIEEVKPDGEVFKVVLREDPALKPYQSVVEIDGGVVDGKDPKKLHPGYVVTRSIVGGSAMLDQDRLSALDPELYERVTVVANYDVLSDLLYMSGVDLEDIDRKLNATNLPRVPRNPDDLSPEDAVAIRQFSFEGPRTVKLLVRYAKEEEIGEG